MGKSLAKKIFHRHRIVLVEGLWGVGKTKLIKSFLEIFDCKFLKEPNHMDENVKNKITEWYSMQHEKRIESAVKISKRKNVILERSSLSSISYKYALTDDFPKESGKVFSLMRSIENLSVIFLYSSRMFAYGRIERVEDVTVREAFKNKDFYLKYLFFYKKVLPDKINKEIIAIKVDRGERFVSSKKIMETILRKLRASERGSL